MRINKEKFTLYMFFSFILITCSSCAIAYEVKRPLVEYVSPIDLEKAKIYVQTFEDVREYSEMGRNRGLFKTIKSYPVEERPKGLTQKYDEQTAKKANIGKVGSDTFICILRQNNINALSLGDSKPTIDKHDLLIKGKVTDYLFRIPYFYPITRLAYYTGLEITVDNCDEKELMNKKYTRAYKIRVPPLGKVSSIAFEKAHGEILDIELREICKEILNDEEFKKVIAALETTEGTD